MTGLEKITGKIEAQAKERARIIIEDAQKQCDVITASYKAKAEKIKEQIDIQMRADAENIITRSKATAAMAKRNVILDAKSQLTESAFLYALEEIKALPADKYIELLAVLLASALKNQVESEAKTAELEGESFSDDNANVGFEVIFNKKDREKYADAVLEAARRMSVGRLTPSVLENIKISDKTADIDGGIILRHGGIECNCAFSMLFSQLRKKCEVEVYGILFGNQK